MNHSQHDPPAAAQAQEAGIGLYLHIPFCRSKCAYCDFASYAGQEALFEAYCGALQAEIRGARGLRARSIYVGGGTPTAMPASLLCPLIESAQEHLTLEPGSEVTVEANPGTIDPSTLSALRGSGVNRLSLGVQSLDDAELKLLGRIHSAGDALEAIRAVRRCGPETLNVDLIFGLPGQSFASWRRSLERILEMEPEHLSLYALSLEEGTPMSTAVERGEISEPDPDRAADLYDMAEERLAVAGYGHYEISNWAREPRYECRHNLIYWWNEPYRGLGAAAHSWMGGRRWSNVMRPAEYVEAMSSSDGPVAFEEEIGAELEMGETMMLGLRLLDEGVSYARFTERFGRDLRQVYGQELDELWALGLIEIGADCVRLTARGHLLGNQAFVRFVPG